MKYYRLFNRDIVCVSVRGIYVYSLGDQCWIEDYGSIDPRYLTSDLEISEEMANEYI